MPLTEVKGRVLRAARSRPDLNVVLSLWLRFIGAKHRLYSKFGYYHFVSCKLKKRLLRRDDKLFHFRTAIHHHSYEN